MARESDRMKTFSWNHATDQLELSDYRRLCGVLDEVLGVDDPVRFEERLEKALARHFGWVDVTVVREPCETGPRGEGMASCRAGCRSTVRQAVGGTTVTAELAAGDTERLYMVVFATEPAERHRQRAVLERLGRYLVPFVRHSVLADVTSDPDPALSLTPRERDVVELVAAGLTNHQIAERLFITLGTVKKHLSQALDKNGCTSRTQLALLWRRDHGTAPSGVTRGRGSPGDG